MSTPDQPGSQNNAAHDGGVQNIAQGGNVYNLNVYPPGSGESGGAPGETIPSGQRGRALSGRKLALAVGGAVAVIAVPTTILAMQYGLLRTENVDSARPAESGAVSPTPTSPSASATAPSTPPASPNTGNAGQTVSTGGTPAPAPAPSTGPTRRSATASSPYPSKDVACTTRWLPTSVINIDMQPCTQAASGTGAAQFGVMLRNAGATQLVVTVSVKPVVSGDYGTCPLHAGPWRQVVIDPGKVWYSSFADCSVSGSVKGHRVQSSARVAGESASDTEVGDARLGLGRAFDISTNGTATPA
ncbi:hypothetical protein ABZZ20_25150 [Streptomyces sp. NPDC006430]|uniref:hypothetical protein n=1 Tax=Streptomyces sp. NPDC006430 TaxID=3154299 RepID=UPI0033A0640A